MGTCPPCHNFRPPPPGQCCPACTSKCISKFQFCLCGLTLQLSLQNVATRARLCRAVLLLADSLPVLSLTLHHVPSLAFPTSVCAQWARYWMSKRRSVSNQVTAFQNSSADTQQPIIISRDFIIKRSQLCDIFKYIWGLMLVHDSVFSKESVTPHVMQLLHCFINVCMIQFTSNLFPNLHNISVRH